MTDESLTDPLETWTQQFDALASTHQDLCTEVENELLKAIDAVPIKIHNFLTRVKERDSFRDKIGRKQYSNPLTEMHDIVAIRVVCLFLDDLEHIDRIIREKFEVRKFEDKTKSLAPDRFGYRSVHYDCQLRSSYCGPRYDHIKTIVFEVQVRTILQDAWAVVEHVLGYKGLVSIPEESQSDFTALVGLFHLADKTFQQIRNSSRNHDAAAEADLNVVATTTADAQLQARAVTPINRSTLKALLRHLFPDRRPATDSGYSEFVEQLARADIVTINELHRLILLQEKHNAKLEMTYSRKRAQEVEAKHSGLKVLRVKTSDVAFARKCVAAASLNFRDKALTLRPAE